MLERIGLPAKPALKGNDWVLDASHCQGCSSAFSFFNWKHYCRRCGGIFCGDCTQQKMTLRGQGDEPVRVCNSCKKSEDAARFEARHGGRIRGAKGSSKSTSQLQADSILKDLEPSVSGPQSSERASLVSNNLEHAKSLQNKSYSSRDEKAHAMDSLLETGDESNEDEQDNPLTPEILRQQALQEKRQWISLKKEGKNEQALLAFKRGKELERQAESLELSLRRSQRKLMNSAITKKEKHEDHSGLGRKNKIRNSTSGEEHQKDVNGGLESVKSKRRLEKNEEKDDLMSDLRELGWADADADIGTKQSKTKTVESELAEITAAVHQGGDGGSKSSVSSVQVLAHKRRALALKREGKLAEAKEELKKAKIIEMQLEEQEMGDVNESDDDLAELIRGMERDTATQTASTSNTGMTNFSGMVDLEHDNYEGIDVTDSDMVDPEMAAALRSIGWQEDTAATSKLQGLKSLGSGRGTKTKDPAIEFMINESIDDSKDDVHVTDEDMGDPYFQSALKAMGYEEESPKVIKSVVPATFEPFEKRNLQQQILTIKREALVLKRAGRIQEAKEKLLQAKNLEKEQGSEHMEGGVTATQLETVDKNAQVGTSGFGTQVRAEETGVDNVDVTDEDMGDPEFANVLKSFGWQDDWANEGSIHKEKKIEAGLPKPFKTSSGVISTIHPPKKRAELQKELLGLKRAAFKLRREGRLEEAEDELKKAQELERQMEESESELGPPKKEANLQNADKVEIPEYQGHEVEVAENSMDDTNKSAALRHGKRMESMPTTAFDNVFASTAHTSIPREKTSEDIKNDQKEDKKTTTSEGDNRFDSEIQNTLAVALSKNTQLSKFDSDHGRQPVLGHSPLSKKAKADDMAGTAEITANSETGDPMSLETLQQEILARKRKALVLKREGKQAEAKEQLREAKMLERRLALLKSKPDVGADSSQPPYSADSTKIFSKGDLGPSSTETLATPMAGSSQQADFPSNTGAGSRNSHMASSVSNQTPAQKYTAGKERMKLQRESLAHKRKALTLRREGRTDEAEAEFDLAKSIEKQMEELGGSEGGTGSMPMGGLDVNPAFGHQDKDDAGLVEDLFDPQLFAALKGLGWKENDLLGQPPTTRKEVRGKPLEQSSGKAEFGSIRKKDERQQLEEKIKSGKIRAVQLKRTGQQAEALNALRGVKQLEQQLQSITP